MTGVVVINFCDFCEQCFCFFHRYRGQFVICDNFCFVFALFMQNDRSVLDAMCNEWKNYFGTQVSWSIVSLLSFKRLRVGTRLRTVHMVWLLSPKIIWYFQVHCWFMRTTLVHAPLFVSYMGTIRACICCPDTVLILSYKPTVTIKRSCFVSVTSFVFDCSPTAFVFAVTEIRFVFWQ